LESEVKATPEEDDVEDYVVMLAVLLAFPTLLGLSVGVWAAWSGYGLMSIAYGVAAACTYLVLGAIAILICHKLAFLWTDNFSPWSRQMKLGLLPFWPLILTFFVLFTLPVVIIRNLFK